MNPYPELKKKSQLALKLGVTTTQVSKWFQHRRETLTRLGQFKAQYNRTRRTPAELDVLQQSFEMDRYPSAERLSQLEQQLDGVTAKQIKLWFKHRRKQATKRNRHKSSSNSSSPTVGSGSQRRSPFHTHPAHQSSSSYPLSQPFPPPSSSILHSLQNTSTISHQPLSTQSSLVPPCPVQQSPESHTGYLLDSNHQPFYSYNNKAPQHGMLVSGTTPPSSGVATGSTPSFTGMEEMALRAARTVMNSKLTIEGLSRLSKFLNRPQSHISHWFSTTGATTDAMADVCTGSANNPAATNNVNAHHTQFVGSPCLTQSDAPPPHVYSGGQPQNQEQSKSENHTNRTTGRCDTPHHQSQDQQQQQQETNQQMQNMVDFSGTKHEAKVSSSNNNDGEKCTTIGDSNGNKNGNLTEEVRNNNVIEVTGTVVESANVTKAEVAMVSGVGLNCGVGAGGAGGNSQNGGSRSGSSCKSHQRIDDSAHKNCEEHSGGHEPGHNGQQQLNNENQVDEDQNGSNGHGQGGVINTFQVISSHVGVGENRQVCSQQQQQQQQQIQPQQIQPQYGVNATNCGAQNPQQQPQQPANGHHQYHQQSMYGGYMYSNDGGMMMGSGGGQHHHQVAGSCSGGGVVGNGQGPPMLAPLRYGGGSPVSGGGGGGYVTSNGMWYQQTPSCNK